MCTDTSPLQLLKIPSMGWKKYLDHKHLRKSIPFTEKSWECGFSSLSAYQKDPLVNVVIIVLFGTFSWFNLRHPYKRGHFYNIWQFKFSFFVIPKWVCKIKSQRRGLTLQIIIYLGPHFMFTLFLLLLIWLQFSTFAVRKGSLKTFC